MSDEEKTTGTSNTTRDPEESSDKKQDDTACIELNTLQVITEIETFMGDMRRRLSEMAPLLKLLRQQTSVLSKRADVGGKRCSKPKKPPKLDNEGNLVKHGFAAPAVLSGKLKKFMNIGPFEKVARTTVTRFMSAYIADNALRDPEDNRYIILKGEKGVALRDLLLGPDQTMTERMLFSDIQKNLKFLIASKAHPLRFADTVFDDGSMDPAEYEIMVTNATAQEEAAAKIVKEREESKRQSKGKGKQRARG